MPLAIIGAGLGRTGTLSLKQALEHLGFAPCYHMFEVVEDPHRPTAWIEAATSPAPDWDGIFNGYRATVDWPAATYWRQLADAYPQAKVILSRRDPETWFESTQKTIFNLKHLGEMSPPFRTMLDLTVYGMFDGRIDDRDHCIDVFERHNRAVIATIAADRLLMFEARQGWEPLCAFLGCDVPRSPYPHLNKAEEFAARD